MLHTIDAHEYCNTSINRKFVSKEMGSLTIIPEEFFYTSNDRSATCANTGDSALGAGGEGFDGRCLSRILGIRVHLHHLLYSDKPSSPKPKNKKKRSPVVGSRTTETAVAKFWPDV